MPSHTATATQAVRRDMRELLQLRDPYEIVTGFDRPNLYFEVRRPTQKLPLLTQLVGEDKVTRIFASVRSRFTDHDRVILTPQDVRLMRRMVRDRFTRNTLPEETMAMWEEVCEGESAYINPFRDSADFKLDTTLDYEPNIFHSFLLPFLEGRRGIAPEHYRKLDDLYQRLDEFFDINNTDAIPQDSVIREFIGPKQTQDQADA